MKRTLILLLIGIMLAGNLYALEDEHRRQVIYHYELTRELYANIVDMLGDFEDSSLDIRDAEERLKEWRAIYIEKAEPVPEENREIHGLMISIIDVTEDIVHKNRLNNQETKDMLKALTGIKDELKREMAKIRFLMK
ncbi:MAG: hypothetical protein ABID09_01490 [Candidatus Omnitrophota bacterium]